MDSAYYVYYRVPAEQKAAARRAVMALFAELRADVGVSGRLARRRDDPGTWMEIYERVADTRRFEQALRAGEQRHGLDKLIAPGSARKVEVFVADVLEPQSQAGDTACA